MSLQDGLTTPSKSLSDLEPTSGTKRKRDDQHDEPTTNGIKPASLTSAPTTGNVGSSIADVFEVLASHDVGPAILNFPIEATSEDAAEVAHQSKKVKTTSSSEGPTTVSRKVKDQSYTSLAELEKDVISICEAQAASLKDQDDGSGVVSKRLSGDDVAQLQDLKSFDAFVRDVVARESSLRKIVDGGHKNANGLKVEDASPSLDSSRPAGRVVLSLYGNASTARQLFSSLQEEDGRMDLALEELGLPTMLSSTRLLPPNSIRKLGEKSKKSTATLGELFAPPSALSSLQPPPRQSRISSNRGSSISFVPAEKFAPKANKKGPYTVQPLTVGKWLRYGTPQRRRGSSAAQIKDHASSLDEKFRSSREDTTLDAPQEDELFASAYCSFAPSYDDSRSVISTHAKNTVWWQKFGKRRLNAMFALPGPQDQEMDIDVSDEVNQRQIELEHEKEVYEELVRDYDEEAISELDDEEWKRPEELESSELLNEISELLRTLSSHQRIRHSIIQNNSRAPSSPSPLRNAMVGTPSEPSSEEIATYRLVVERLADLVSRVPPYVASKLAGQQMEDLMVSRNILIEASSKRGVLEEDQLTKMARSVAASAAAASAAAAAATNSTTGRSTSNQYGQYGRGLGSGNSRNALTPQSYQGSRGSVSYGRSSSGLAASTPTQPARQSYSQAGSYTAPVNRTALQQGAQQYGQRQGFGTQHYGQGSPLQPQARPHQYPQQQYRDTRYSMSIPQAGQSSQPAYGVNTARSTQGSYQNHGMQSANGRSTPVNNIAPAPPGYQNSPVKLASQQPYQQQMSMGGSAAPQRPNSATPQPVASAPSPAPQSAAPVPRMNGTSTPGAT